MLVDLHAHTGPGAPPPADVVERAARVGLDGVALVGANTIPDLREVQAPRGFAVFAGAEIQTDRGRYLVFLPKPERLPPISEIFATAQPWPIRDVLARAAALGGVVVAARPYDRSVAPAGGDIVYTLRGLAAIETVNGHLSGEPVTRAVEAAETLGIPCIGGSDAATLDALGRAATLFPEPISNEQELCEALRAGHCWAVEFGAPDEVTRRLAASPRAPVDRERRRRRHR